MFPIDSVVELVLCCRWILSIKLFLYTTLGKEKEMRKYRLKLMVMALAVVFGFVPSIAHAAGAITVDFTTAGSTIGITPTTDSNGVAGAPNGIFDFDEYAVIAAILADVTDPNHVLVHAAYTQALASATTDLAALLGAFPLAPIAIGGGTLISNDTFTALDAFTTGFGAPLAGDYTLALALDPLLAPSGDVDGDSFSNLDEHTAFIGGGQAAYVAAVLDPTVALAATTSGGGTVLVGDPLALSGTVLNASGGETFQWRVDTGSGFVDVTDGGSVSGATTAAVSISPTLLSDSGTYVLVVTGGFGSVSSSTQSVTIVAGLPTSSNTSLMILVGLIALCGMAIQRKVRIS